MAETSAGWISRHQGQPIHRHLSSGILWHVATWQIWTSLPSPQGCKGCGPDDLGYQHCGKTKKEFTKGRKKEEDKVQNVDMLLKYTEFSWNGKTIIHSRAKPENQLRPSLSQGVRLLGTARIVSRAKRGRQLLYCGHAASGPCSPSQSALCLSFRIASRSVRLPVDWRGHCSRRARRMGWSHSWPRQEEQR